MKTNNNIEVQEVEVVETSEKVVEVKENKLARLCGKLSEKVKSGSKYVWEHKKEIAIAGGLAASAFIVGALVGSKYDDEYDETNFIEDNSTDFIQEPALLEMTETEEVEPTIIEAEEVIDSVEAE